MDGVVGESAISLPGIRMKLLFGGLVFFCVCVCLREWGDVAIENKD